MPSDCWGSILSYIQDYKDFCSARLACKAFLKHLPKEEFARCVYWKYVTKEDIPQGYSWKLEDLAWKTRKEYPENPYYAIEMLGERPLWKIDEYLPNRICNITKYSKDLEICWSGNIGHNESIIFTKNNSPLAVANFYNGSCWSFCKYNSGKIDYETLWSGQLTTHRDSAGITCWRDENVVSKVSYERTGEEIFTDPSYQMKRPHRSTLEVITDPEDQQRMNVRWYHQHIGKTTKIYPHAEIVEGTEGGKSKITTFYRNGKIKSVKNFLLGRPHGFHAVWSRRGQLLYKGIYYYNELLSAKHYNGRQ